MSQTWISQNEDQTTIIAKEIADGLNYPTVICLNGDLGAGKTALSRALIRYLLNDPDMVVPSPTYTLVQTYDDDAIWHFDLYRLDTPDQLYDVGWEEALSAKLCLIEWPDKAGTLLPDNRIDITINTEKNGDKLIKMTK
jgi:tRNA threonylcarbamoyl adenosine modification protein YjeE